MIVADVFNFRTSAHLLLMTDETSLVNNIAPALSRPRPANTSYDYKSAATSCCVDMSLLFL